MGDRTDTASRAALQFQPDEQFAQDLDARDPLKRFRDQFHIPARQHGEPAIYFAGNSLGLQPRSVRRLLDQELRDWSDLAVDAHFDGKTPWYSYHEVLREPLSRLVGALPHEVVAMNSLTVNLHLLMVSFYRPTPKRYKIAVEYPAFPSDLYAVQTQLEFHGYDPSDALIMIRPPQGEHLHRTEDFESLLKREGDSIALVMLGGVNFYSGQSYDIARITSAAQRRGCVVGWDLAHAAGNVPLALHDWNVDFAAWCSYKYLNSGPGAVAGCFIHERHAKNIDLPRFGGWWGNDPDTRFRMHLESKFIPVKRADAWQLSNPPIMALAPVRASLELFDEATIPALRAKSERLTGYLQYLIECEANDAYQVITPSDPNQRGCQLSILAHRQPRTLLKSLHSAGVVCDFREPNVIRVAPVPMYNTYHEVWRFSQLLANADRGAT